MAKVAGGGGPKKKTGAPVANNRQGIPNSWDLTGEPRKSDIDQYRAESLMRAEDKARRGDRTPRSKVFTPGWPAPYNPRRRT